MCALPLVLSGGAVAGPGRPASATGPGPAASAPATTPPSPKAQAASRPATTSAPSPGFLDRQGSHPLVTRPDSSGVGMTWTLVASVLIVFVLGVLAFLVVKRVLPRLGVKVGRQIRVLETSYLGPRKAVHLLQVGSQRFLVGSTRDRITMLSEVTLAFLDEDGPIARAPHGGDE